MWHLPGECHIVRAFNDKKICWFAGLFLVKCPGGMEKLHLMKKKKRNVREEGVEKSLIEILMLYIYFCIDTCTFHTHVQTGVSVHRKQNLSKLHCLAV